MFDSPPGDALFSSFSSLFCTLFRHVFQSATDALSLWVSGSRDTFTENRVQRKKTRKRKETMKKCPDSDI